MGLFNRDKHNYGSDPAVADMLSTHGAKMEGLCKKMRRLDQSLRSLHDEVDELRGRVGAKTSPPVGDPHKVIIEASGPGPTIRTYGVCAGFGVIQILHTWLNEATRGTHGRLDLQPAKVIDREGRIIRLVGKPIFAGLVGLSGNKPSAHEVLYYAGALMNDPDIPRLVREGRLGSSRCDLSPDAR